jgi:DNA-binding Lrp family transcriptional regulator
MKPDKTEYPKIQQSILQFLFDQAKATTFTAIVNLVNKPESEVRYHCDVLAGQQVITGESVRVGSGFVGGYVITAAGRKRIMEQ